MKINKEEIFFNFELSEEEEEAWRPFSEDDDDDVLLLLLIAVKVDVDGDRPALDCRLDMLRPQI